MEFHTLAQLAHPRVVAVYDYQKLAEGAVYSMELLDGDDLQKEQVLPWKVVCAFFAMCVPPFRCCTLGVWCTAMSRAQYPPHARWQGQAHRFWRDGALWNPRARGGNSVIYGA